MAAFYAPDMTSQQPHMAAGPQGAFLPAPYFAAAPVQQFFAQPAFAQQVMDPNGADELRTVFISNFPADTKERELNNLCRFIPQYEASQMHYRNGHVQGFALFSTGAAARTAVEAINNLVFDDNMVLRAELAHKNMYVKDDPGAPKRSRPATLDGAPPGVAFATPMPFAAAPPGPAVMAGSGPVPGAPGVAPPGPAPGAPGSAYTYATTMPPNARLPPMMPCGYELVTNARDNPPCNTLFIGNLGDHVSEAELRGLFSHQPGFQQLKLVRGPKGLSCFMEFSDVATATACHDRQQGAILQSSDRGGIRIQFSKNPFGRKRDALGNPVEAQTTVQKHAQVPAAAAAQAPVAQQQQQQQMPQPGAQQPLAARAGGEVSGEPSTKPAANADQQQAQVNGSGATAGLP